MLFCLLAIFGLTEGQYTATVSSSPYVSSSASSYPSFSSPFTSPYASSYPSYTSPYSPYSPVTYPSFAPGCVADWQCGSNRRCDNGQCLTNAGDLSCDSVYDCYSCLQRPNCLWDPNTVRGSCKPKEQCDFTYQPRALNLGGAYASVAPQTACVATVDRCSQSNFNGAPITVNPDQGVGCTNHGQCPTGSYCFSCSKCRTTPSSSCGSCNLPGAIPTSGSCGPAWRCPIDNDSISGTCPSTSVTPVSSCYYSSCSVCTAQYGCVWSGSSCYYSTSSCSGFGCANTPSQCGVSSYPITSCAYSNCQSCAAAQGCLWSGSYCYYSTTPCTTYGCANTPDQCYASSGPVVGGSGSCSNYFSCASCLSNPSCLWDPNAAFGNCKPQSQCDFTYQPRALILNSVAAAPPATACVRVVSQCYAPPPNGAILDPNYNRGIGCTNHGQCPSGQYCFSCTRCRGSVATDCGLCSAQYQGGVPVSGSCGPSWRCAIDNDSIDYTCPSY